MPRYASLYERLVAHVKEPEADNGCWEHDGTCNNRSGYPTINVWENGKVKHKYAFRVMYEEVYGPLTEGYQVDHLCQNTRCVNPDHLMAMPARLNHRLVYIRANGTEVHLTQVYRVLSTTAAAAAEIKIKRFDGLF